MGLDLLEFQGKGRAGDGVTGGLCWQQLGNTREPQGTAPLTFHPGKTSESLPNPLSFPIGMTRSPLEEVPTNARWWSWMLLKASPVFAVFLRG